MSYSKLCFRRATLTLCIGLTFTVFSVASELFLIKPASVSGDAGELTSRMAKGESQEEYIVGRSPVALATNFLALCRSANVSDSLVMRFADPTPGKPDKMLRVRVGAPPDKVLDDIVTLSASLESCELQTVLITADSRYVIVTIQDLKTGRIYRMNGDLSTGTGEVVEFDPSKLPPSDHLPSIIPRE